VPSLDQFVGSLKAASETTRLRILALLAEGELSVKDITDILGQSQPRVSRHLKLLADGGLAERHAEGAWAYYRLNSKGAEGELARQLVSALDQSDSVLSEDRQRLDKVRESQAAQAASYFAQVAESWDLLRNMHVPESDIEAAILAVAAAREIGKVIDLGTGTGRMLELLAPYYQEGIGLDSSRQMVAVARAKLASAGVQHAQVRLADISESLEGVGQADLVILHQVLHYFDDPGRVLQRAARHLKPGGQVLVVDFAPHKMEFLRNEHAHRRLGMSEEQMAAWAADAGLDVQSVKPFSPKSPDKLTVCLWVLSSQPETVK
jgi:ubiquinone/menaquinone biosynthesis C-methylase UbiE/DNA-binding transcriptional ArsR family regulator